MDEEKETRPGLSWLQDIFGAANIHVVQKQVPDSSISQTVYQIETDKIERQLAMPPMQFQEYLEYCAIVCKPVDYRYTRQYGNRGPLLEIAADSLDRAVRDVGGKHADTLADFKAELINRTALSEAGQLHLHPQAVNYRRVRENIGWHEGVAAMAKEAPPVEPSSRRRGADGKRNAREQAGWDFLLEVFPKATKWQLQNTFAGNEMPCFAIDLSKLTEAEEGNLARLKHCLDQCDVPHKQDNMMIDLDQGEYVERVPVLFIPRDALLSRLEPVYENWLQMGRVATLTPPRRTPLTAIDASSAVSADYAKHPGFRWLAGIFGKDQVTVVKLAGDDYYQVPRAHAERILGIEGTQIISHLKCLDVLGISTDYTHGGGEHMLEFSAEQLDAVVSEGKEGIANIKDKFLLLKQEAEKAARPAESNILPLVRAKGEGPGTAR